MMDLWFFKVWASNEIKIEKNKWNNMILMGQGHGSGIFVNTEATNQNAAYKAMKRNNLIGQA
jgi:hypothetical protein